MEKYRELMLDAPNGICEGVFNGDQRVWKCNQKEGRTVCRALYTEDEYEALTHVPTFGAKGKKRRGTHDTFFSQVLQPRLQRQEWLELSQIHGHLPSLRRIVRVTEDVPYLGPRGSKGIGVYNKVARVLLTDDLQGEPGLSEDKAEQESSSGRRQRRQED